MENVMQGASSQSNTIDAINNNEHGKKNSLKPPLLPKPQITYLNSEGQKVVKIASNSQRLLTKNNTSKVVAVDESNPASNISNNKTLCQKPPLISPKPKLSLKSNNIASSKSLILSNNITLEETNKLIKQSLPSKNISFSQSKTSENIVQNDNYGDFTNQAVVPVQDICQPPNLILDNQNNSNISKNEEVNLIVKDLIDSEPNQLSEFCKQVENCSKHSYLLKSNFNSFVHSQQKNFKKETEMTFNDVITKTNSTDSSKNYENFEEHCFSKNSKCINKNFENEVVHDLREDAENIRNQESCNCNNSSELPKSFLYNYANFCNKTKGSEHLNENSVKKNVNIQSFLYKNKDQCDLKSNHTESPRQPDLTNSFGEIAIISNTDNEGNNRDQTQITKNCDNLDSGSIAFSKRFPWFGSFGKGYKKEFEKKKRCISQFYATTAVVDSQMTLRQKNRAKSLPDIKQSRIASDGTAINKSSNSTSPNSNFLQCSSKYANSDSDDDKDSLNQIDINSEKDCNILAYLKAKELMTSEEVFVDVLKLLNVDFRNYVELRNFEAKNTCIPPGEINKILNHLPQLQCLNENILEDLQKRINNWENNPKISDIIVKKGAFLKMYTSYIQNFESQTNYLDECMIKYPKFGKIVKEFEASEKCKKLTLKHYMLKPVQRIPQYRLLLNDYLKRLDESMADYADTLNALKIVCDVVDHANRNLGHGDKDGRLMHFQSILSDYELIKPGRELIKDGLLEKICRKSVKDRYFILLNDCFLHTTYSKQYLKIHQELPLSGMKICCNEDQKYPHSFTVHSITRSFILCAKNEAECKEWVEILQKTIEEYIKKQKTFLNVKIEMEDSFKLGKEAPVWVPDSKVTMCQICTAEFTALFRRHHCRGCGKVVCRNCGSNQAPLQYRNFKADRVCDQCFEILWKEYEVDEEAIYQLLKQSLNFDNENIQNEYFTIKAKFIKYTPSNNWKKQKYIPHRLKEVSANDSESTINGWLFRKSRKSWKLFWYVLKDHVLYVYKASEDVLALETIPVLGYDVERGNINLEDADENLIFALSHPHQSPIIFKAETQTSAERWFDALRAATNFEDMI